ncbi:MAG: adenosylmethionine--8-amino-7-oxononanoate transaminase [Actinomycetota bacterium]
MTAPAEAGLLDRDAAHLWHPYGAAGARQLYAVRGARGVHLDLEGPGGERHRAIDAMASWWSVVHGHGHPALVEALTRQAAAFPHVMFGGLTHAPAVDLAERLVAHTPAALEHVFLADSGSVSVEVALKLALQYQATRGRPSRRRFLTVRGGYHGDTAAPMGVCDPVDGMHAAFTSLVARHLFLPRPPAARWVPEGVAAAPMAPDAAPAGHWEADDAPLAAWEDEARAFTAAHADEIAGVILEPVLQGAGGMRVYDPRCLTVLRELCDEHGLLLIADEIATGFGRTGRWLACEGAGVAPDVLCLGKALTGGTMTGAAMLCTAEVAETVSRRDHGMPGALLHGPTFMGNPLMCAVASASLDLLTDPRDGWAAQVPRVEAGLRAGLAAAADLPAVTDVRVLGAVGVVELDRTVDVEPVTRAAVARGAWVRPFRRLVYVMPPYVSTDDDVATICAAVTGAVEEVCA